MRKNTFAAPLLPLILAIFMPLALRSFAAPRPQVGIQQQSKAASASAPGVELVSGGTELRFAVGHIHGGMLPSGCFGYLYISRTSVRYEVLGPDKFKDHSFARSRADVVKAGDPGAFKRKLPNDFLIEFKDGQSERFGLVDDPQAAQGRSILSVGQHFLSRAPLVQAFSDFDQALAAAGGTSASSDSAIAAAGYGATAAPGGPTSAAALPAPSPSAGFYADARVDFDTLDGVTVDLQKGTFTLLGHRAGNGAARQVPYLDYLAAAMESSNPTFSLEWTPDSSRSIDRAFQMADQDLTNRLAGTVDATGHLTARGEWWYRMLGADVRQGMDKMSAWTAIFAVSGYPDAAKVMQTVDEVERAGADGDKKVRDPDGAYRSPVEHFMNATISLVVPFDQNYLDTYGAMLGGNASARETVISWALTGLARAYRVDESRYVNNYLSLTRSGTDFGTALAKTLELSQDDTVQVQKNAFYALVGNRTFIHVPPEIMSQVLGISPVVTPVYQGLRPDSLLARTAFEADVFGKNLMDMPEIKSEIPAYRTYFEWRQTVPRAPAAEGHTWFAPDGFELIESADGNTLRFGRTPVRIHMERYENGSRGRQSVDDPLLAQYANELTSLYDPLAARFPVLLDLRESMKVMAIADWLKRKGVKLSFPAQGRGYWTPPAQYPGVIHMEIAVAEAPVGEVMSASGGIDFRVDQNWKFAKQAASEQPAPLPANASEVTEAFNPASGAVENTPVIVAQNKQSNIQMRDFQGTLNGQSDQHRLDPAPALQNKDSQNGGTGSNIQTRDFQDTLNGQSDQHRLDPAPALQNKDGQNGSTGSNIQTRDFQDTLSGQGDQYRVDPAPALQNKDSQNGGAGSNIQTRDFQDTLSGQGDLHRLDPAPALQNKDGQNGSTGSNIQTRDFQDTLSGQGDQYRVDPAPALQNKDSQNGGAGSNIQTRDFQDTLSGQGDLHRLDPAPALQNKDGQNGSTGSNIQTRDFQDTLSGQGDQYRVDPAPALQNKDSQNGGAGSNIQTRDFQDTLSGQGDLHRLDPAPALQNSGNPSSAAPQPRVPPPSPAAPQAGAAPAPPGAPAPASPPQPASPPAAGSQVPKSLSLTPPDFDQSGSPESSATGDAIRLQPSANGAPAPTAAPRAPAGAQNGATPAAPPPAQPLPPPAQAAPDASRPAAPSVREDGNPGALPQPAAGPATSVRIGLTGAATGSVSMVTPDGREVPIAAGSPVFLNEHIRTAPGGRLQVMLLDDTVFVVGSGSDLVLDEFVYDPNAGAGKVTARLVKGVFRFVSGKAGHSQPDNLKVNVPTGTIGIRGTEFEVFVAADQSGYIKLFSGQLDFTEARTGRVTVLNAGQMVILNTDGTVSSPVPLTQ